MVDLCSEFTRLADELEGDRVNAAADVIDVDRDALPLALIYRYSLLLLDELHDIGELLCAKFAQLASRVDFELAAVIFHRAKGADIDDSIYIFNFVLMDNKLSHNLNSPLISR